MDTQKYAGAAWPFVLVILTGIYGYWAVQRELVSSRPSVPGQYDVPDPVPPLGIRSLHSRLWQDPFSTAYEHWKSLPDKARAAHLTSVPDSEELTNAVQNVATSSAGSESDSATPIEDELHLAQQAADMRKFFRSIVDGKKTVCMPVLLSGGPYAEDKEKRMRIRYAVVTALAEAGYSLKYSRRMSYVVVKIHVRVLRGWQEREIVVPVKLYSHDDGPWVLVLWINESELELRPLLALHRILNAMFTEVSNPENLAVSIIGPSSSGTLSNMSFEISHINDTFLPKLIHEANRSEGTAGETAACHRSCIEDAYREIQRQASRVDIAARIGKISGADVIRQKAALIVKTRNLSDIRKFVKAITETAGEGPDATVVEIREAAEEIDLLVDEIKGEAEELAERAYLDIQDVAGSLKDAIADQADTRARESIGTEANILSETVSVIWQTADDIEKLATDLNSGEAGDRKTRAMNIKRAASEMELAEASAVIRRQVNDINREAHAVFQREVDKIIKETVQQITPMVKDLDWLEPDERDNLGQSIQPSISKVELTNNSADIRSAVRHIKNAIDSVKQKQREQARRKDDVISIIDATVYVAEATDTIELARAYAVSRGKAADFIRAGDNTKARLDGQPKMRSESGGVVKTTESAELRELAEAFAVIELAADNVRQGEDGAKLTSEAEAESTVDKKLIDVTVKLMDAALNVTKAAEGAATLARAGETTTGAGRGAEPITLPVFEEALNIKRIAANSKIAGAAEIRKAADVIARSVKSVQRIAEDFRDLESSYWDRLNSRQRGLVDRVKSEPVTVIQRAVAVIKREAEEVEDGKAKTIDVASIAQQLDRIRVAQAYALAKQAADRIDRNAQTIGDEALKQTVTRIKRDAYEIIQQLGGNIAPNKNSNYWYVTADSEKNAQRMRGFMPLLSSLENGGDTAQLFSPRATMDDIDFAENNFVRLHRVIGKDQQLAETLYDELKLRGAVPGQIVLITEHDTAYGRAFPATFENVFPIDFETQIQPILEQRRCLRCHGRDKETRTPKVALRLDLRRRALAVIEPGNSERSELVRKLNSQKEDPDHAVEESQLELLKRWIDQGAAYKHTAAPSNLITFKILRGIDGSVPGDNSNRLARGQESGKKSSPTELPEIVERLPEGRTQYDYLKRLRHRIEELPAVDAIGVVGSDVYDKLLVLRALKPHFPDCVFFTTDLDAIYTHPDERRHTRNLLIASHFDLRLDDQLQQSTPPFRDSYQTATFLAARLAVHHNDPDYRHAQIHQADEDPDYGGSTTNWSAVVDHWFGDKKDKDELKVDPVLHVVGRVSTLPLTDFDEKDIAGKVHPELSDVARTWHYFFVGGFTLAAVGLAWVLVHRDEFRESQLLNNEGDIRWIRGLLRRGRRQIGRARWLLRRTKRRQGVVQSLDELLESLRRLLKRRGKSLESYVNLGLLVLSGIGCGLVLVLFFRGYMSSERSDFLGGYSTWPRKILYGLAGIFAVLSVAGVLDQFQIRLQEVRKECKQVGDLASNCFQEVHIAKIALLALIIAFTAGAFVYELTFGGFWIPGLATFCGLSAAWWYRAERRPRQNEPTSRGSDTADSAAAPGARVEEEPAPGNLILGLDLTPAVGYGLISVIGVAAIAFLGDRLMDESHVGWYPATTSRDWLSRFGDWLATVYAFGAVALLLSTMIYFHLWCREFARYARSIRKKAKDVELNTPELEGDEEHQKARALILENFADEDWQFEHDRLWTIGRLSSAAGRRGPVLMALLFVLVMAYHPWLSPRPMPLSLVVMTTVSVMVFIVSALSLRWHFHSERDKTLAELRRELEKIGETPEASEDLQEERQSSTRQEKLRQRALDSIDHVDPRHGQEPEPAKSLNAVLELDEQVEEEETETSPPPKNQRAEPKSSLTTHKERIEAISEGVFRSWNQSPLGWILGGGTTLALVDLWVRWWTIGL